MRGVTDDTPPGWKRNTAIFLAGQTASLLGSMLVSYAVMWHLTLETRSGTVMMWSIVLGMLPQAFVSLFGGVWADRHNRKFLIIGADVAIAVVTLALAVTIASGVDDLWVIYLGLAVRSVFAGIHTPAVNAVIPQIVPSDQLLRINGLNQSIQSGMMLLAPILAGALYAALGIVAVFFVDVATAAVAVALLTLVPVSRVVRDAEARASEDGAAAERPGYFDDLVEGLRYIAHRASVRWFMVIFGVTVLLLGAPSYLTPLMVARTFGEEVWKLTANEVAWALGMLGTGLLLAVLGQRVTRPMRLVVLAVLAAGALTAALGLATDMWVFFAIGLGVAASFTLMTGPAFTVLQQTVEPEMQGRVFGFVGVVMAVAMPLSMVVFGPLADRFSVESLLVVAGLLLLAFMAGLWSVPAARHSLQRIAATTAEHAEVVAR